MCHRQKRFLEAGKRTDKMLINTVSVLVIIIESDKLSVMRRFYNYIKLHV